MKFNLPDFQTLWDPQTERMQSSMLTTRGHSQLSSWQLWMLNAASLWLLLVLMRGPVMGGPANFYLWSGASQWCSPTPWRCPASKSTEHLRPQPCECVCVWGRWRRSTPQGPPRGPFQESASFQGAGSSTVGWPGSFIRREREIELRVQCLGLYSQGSLKNTNKMVLLLLSTQSVSELPVKFQHWSVWLQILTMCWLQ